MPDWAIWVIVAAGLVGLEAVSLTFVFGPLALAALLAALVAALGLGLAVQLIVFAVTAAASVLLLRPIARRHLRTPVDLRTGTAALVGSSALVLERVDRDGGLVKLGGETWTARTFDDDRVFEPGERVSVLQIQGATALISD